MSWRLHVTFIIAAAVALIRAAGGSTARQVRKPVLPPKVARASQPQLWWSFRKPVPPPIPNVHDTAWVRNPIDAFVLGKLEAKGLHPAPPTDKRTLIRRAYFDLIGIPPPPERVENFVNASTPNAYERLIDELLASPQYGERWGGTGWMSPATRIQADTKPTSTTRTPGATVTT